MCEQRQRHEWVEACGVGLCSVRSYGGVPIAALQAELETPEEVAGTFEAF
jgi:hypothetical protein